MRIHLTCNNCRHKLSAPEKYSGRKAHCPHCGAEFVIPEVVPAEEVVDAELVEAPPADSAWDLKLLRGLHEPKRVRDFAEPPRSFRAAPVGAASARPTAGESSAAVQPTAGPGWGRRMFEAIIDPRSIQWLLAMGGGLMVLGGLIWLISKGIFKEPLPLAIIFGIGSVGLLATGWFVNLKTRFKIAGRALTFLACVVLPLNLWFYHAQSLLLLEQGLWVGGVVCVILYLVTVWLMRDALFVYAVEVGITLTAVLFLGSLGLAGSATHLSFVLMVLAVISIHGRLAFPEQAEHFERDRFGLPLFWSGHLQLLASLIILFGSQLSGWFNIVGDLFGLPDQGIFLTNSVWASGLLWLTACYLYLYSELFVRRIGLYMNLAAVSLIMAEITLLDIEFFGVNGMIAVLANTACVISFATKFVPKSNENLARGVAPLALILSVVPVAIGLVRYVWAEPLNAMDLNGMGSTANQIISWKFVIAMLVVAIANRVFVICL